MCRQRTAVSIVLYCTASNRAVHLPRELTARKACLFQFDFNRHGLHAPRRKLRQRVHVLLSPLAKVCWHEQKKKTCCVGRDISGIINAARL